MQSMSPQAPLVSKKTKQTSKEHSGGFKNAQEKTANSLTKQVGADHYTSLGIQPWEIALANKLNPWEYSIMKYVLRHQKKNGKQDLEKAIHNLEFLIENYEQVYENTK